MEKERFITCEAGAVWLLSMSNWVSIHSVRDPEMLFRLTGVPSVEAFLG